MSLTIGMNVATANILSIKAPVRPETVEKTKNNLVSSPPLSSKTPLAIRVVTPLNCNVPTDAVVVYENADFSVDTIKASIRDGELMTNQKLKDIEMS